MQDCGVNVQLPLKVLLVTEPGVDGVFRHVEALANHLIKRGHNVSLAYSTRRGSDRLALLAQIVEFGGGMTVDLNVGNSPEARDFLAILKLWGLCREFQPDVIHAHSSKAGALVRLLLLISGLPIRSFYTPNAYFGLGRLPGFRTAYYNAIERCLGKIGTTINVSYDEFEFAKKTLRIDSSRLHVVSNGVDTDVFVPADRMTRNRLRSDFGVPSRARVLGTVGRFSRQKDYDTLYRALLPVMERHADLHFIHLGAKAAQAPDEGKYLLRMGRLTMIEYLADPLPIYQLMDGFILSSLYEGLSYAILEALSCNLPLILSYAPGNRDLFQHSLSHLWPVDIGDVSGFTTAIERWRMALDEEKPMNHRSVAKRIYSVENCGDSVIDLYKTSIV